MNTRANVNQERPFQHTAQSMNDIFNSKSRPTSGKSISVSRPTTPSSQTQLRFIRPQSTRGNQKINSSTVSRQTSQFANNQKKLNASFVEDTYQIEGIFN
jgi:hypothetical protein